MSELPQNPSKTRYSGVFRELSTPRGENAPNTCVRWIPTHKTGAAPPQTTRPAATRSAIPVTTKHLTYLGPCSVKGGR